MKKGQRSYTTNINNVHSLIKDLEAIDIKRDGNNPSYMNRYYLNDFRDVDLLKLLEIILSRLFPRLPVRVFELILGRFSIATYRKISDATKGKFLDYNTLCEIYRDLNNNH